MIKYIIFLISIQLLLYADYKIVQKYYDAGKYEKTILEARASKSEYSKPGLHLLWARSAYKLGRLDEAMSAYERVVMMDENNIDAKVELAKIYDETSRTILAKEISKELTGYKMTPEQRDVLETINNIYLQTFKNSISFVFGYDSNINVSAEADKLDDFYNITGSNGEIYSSFSRLNASLGYTNDFTDAGGYYVKADVMVYNQNNFNAHYYDMFIFNVDLGIGYKGTDYNIYTAVGVDKVNYLDTSLMNQYKFAPKISINLNPNYLLNINAGYKQRIYNDKKYETMDDSSICMGLGIYYIQNKNIVYLNTKYESFSADKDAQASNLNKDVLTLSMGVNFPINQSISTKVDYRYKNSSYNIGSREDNYHQGDIKLSYSFANDYQFFISERYAENSSDYFPANYTKNLTILGLSMSY